MISRLKKNQLSVLKMKDRENRLTRVSLKVFLEVIQRPNALLVSPTKKGAIKNHAFSSITTNKKN